MTARRAVVHEWVAERAGSEQVFERLAAILPDAELFALTAEDGVIETCGRPIRTSFLDGTPLRKRRGVSLPLMPLAWRMLRKNLDFDLVVSSAHAFAREFVNPRRVHRHLCYVHTPMRYAWDRATDPRHDSIFARPAAAVLRRIDFRSTPHVHQYAANSTTTKRRIENYYKRDSVVIYPPVRVNQFKSVERAPSGYLLAYGRFVRYKRFDLAIEVAEAAGMPLKLAGSGPLADELKKRSSEAAVPIEIIPRPDDERLSELLGGAEALLFPGIEDFGIVPVEAQAAGVPVVGPAAGGLCDTVDSGVTGILASDQTVESLKSSLCELLNYGINADACRAWAQRFSQERFDAEVLAWIRDNE